VDSLREYQSQILSVAALLGVVVLAITGSIAGEAAITFIGGLLMRNPVDAFRG